MKQYIKDNKILPRNKIVINTTQDGQDVQIINPTHETLLEHGWIEYVEPELTEEQLLRIAKEEKKREILHYDSSISVNEFFINDVSVWLDKNTRAGLKLRFEAELALKKANTTLWYEGQQFVLQLNTAMQMLYALECYASECYDNTQLHLFEVDKLASIEEVEVYDYAIGYPEKLRF